MGDLLIVSWNFLRGMCGFFLIIVNIILDGMVILLFYFYKEGWSIYERGEIKLFCGEYCSFFKEVEVIWRNIEMDEDKSIIVYEYWLRVWKDFVEVKMNVLLRFE